ncbi:MAG TPA: spore coat U domain-containing protein [Methylococcus sp.]|nr:spore coat U domain-containing protein [Methylococcus sp.]
MGYVRAAVLLALRLGAGVVGWTGAAHAAPPVCTINVTPVSFGGYDVFSPAAAVSLGTITYHCTASTSIRIEIDRGMAASSGHRAMIGADDRLRYELYLDAAGTVAWGDGSGGTQVYQDPAPPPGANVTVPIYARLPAGQDVAHGRYTDRLVVRMNY